MNDEITIENIHEEAKKLGVEIDHHESDLYIPVTPETTALVARYKSKCNVTTFIERAMPDRSRCVLCGKIKESLGAPIKAWYDIPFAYSPFWDKVVESTTKKISNGHWR